MSIPTKIAEDLPMTEDSLRALLAAHGVLFATWGQGKAKTLTHLLQELERGECHFEPAQADFPLVRRVEGVRIDVFYDAPSGRQRLIEERQVFNDGRARRRPDAFSL